MNFVIIFLVLLSTSWTGQAETEEKNKDTSFKAEDEKWERARDVNEFGYKLTREFMKQNINKNVVLSPTGVAGLLAMTLLGSVSSTYDELARTIGFSQDVLTNRKNHEELGSLLLGLNSDKSSHTLYADAIFVDEHTKIRALYREYLSRVYNGVALPAKFSDQDRAKEVINEWVKNNTDGKIEDFLQEPLPMTTQVVLLSALFFSGTWERPFTPEFTSKMNFNTPSQDILADLMLSIGDFKHIISTHDEVQMIALPYNDNITTMYVIKPLHPQQVTLPELMERLNYTRINALINHMRKEECVIRFPKMELKVKANLEKSLKALGLVSLFSPTKANFALMIDNNRIVNNSEQELLTRISEGIVEETRDLKNKLNSLANPGVYVDSVLHDVKITIDELGTEAAAATSGILARSAEMFYADSPFYMFIRNEKTKLVTFSAAIFDPTK